MVLLPHKLGVLCLGGHTAAPSLGERGWLLILARDVAIFSSESMACGPFVALFTVWWAPGSLLGTAINSDILT
jgi:hypothetical protein